MHCNVRLPHLMRRYNYPGMETNVVLTIDSNIQHFAEEELEIACEKWKPLSATAIAMDPMTGEVLAMANYPTYDPNHFKKYPSNTRKNLAITDFTNLVH